MDTEFRLIFLKASKSKNPTTRLLFFSFKFSGENYVLVQQTEYHSVKERECVLDYRYYKA